MDPWKVSGFLEDGRAKWMVISVFFHRGDRFRGTLRIGLWDPFQMAVSWLIHEGY